MYFHWKILVIGILISYVSFLKGNCGNQPPQDAAARISQGISSLGRELFTILTSASDPYQNVLISPANIIEAVALLHAAAEGNTLEQLSNMMGIPPDKNYSKSIVQSVLSCFYGNISTTDTDQVVLNVAAAFFLQIGFPIKKNYQDYVVKYYEAYVENINFEDGKAAAGAINNYVSNKTRGLIPGIVNENIDPSTVAMIITTLFFNGTWQNTFDKSNTKNDTFFNGEKNVDVQMMNLVSRFPYVNNTKLQFQSINLPYAGSEYALNIILPYECQKIEKLIPKLANLSINQIMEQSETVGVDLKMPKVKFNWKSSLKSTFQQLGVQDIFTDNANLTDLTDAKIKVSDIIHATEIKITESGTEAAAVTAVGIVSLAITSPPTSPVLFYVNRPCMLTIYNTNESEIPLPLFTSVMYNPVASS